MKNLLPILSLCVMPCAMGLHASGQENNPVDKTPPVLESFRFTDKTGAEQTVQGRLVVEAADGGVLVEDRTGTLWNITPKQLVERKPDEDKFTPLSTEEHIAQLRAELGPTFHEYQTPRYLVVSNAAEVYTKWCGDQLERFATGFFAYWNDKIGLDLKAPKSKLVVIVFANKDQFIDFSRRDIGQKTQSEFGYYSVRRNRVVLYDFATTGEPLRTEKDVRAAVRDVPFSVATMLHEATHQLGFNTGLHTRYADNPVWYVEGLAMFCETPDTGRSKWTKIGRANNWRKRAFAAYGNVPADALAKLVQSDDQFRKPETAGNAYSESWGLTMYLMNRKRNEFIAFIKKNANNPRLVWPKPEERLATFREIIGSPVDFEKPMNSYLKRFR